MTGWRKRTIMEMAKEAEFELDCVSLEWHKRIEAFAALVREDALAQPEQDGDFRPDWMNYQEGFAAGVLEGREQMKQTAPVQEPVAEIQEDMKGGGYVKWLSEDFFVAGTKLYTTPPAQSPQQEPVAGWEAWNTISRLNRALEEIRDYAHDKSTGSTVPDALWEIRSMAFYAIEEATPPAQPEERNFCSRCGKRTRNLTTIHTCTPPQEKYTYGTPLLDAMTSKDKNS
jgi:hypothetical protein